jgi:hypothetical protein
MLASAQLMVMRARVDSSNNPVCPLLAGASHCADLDQPNWMHKMSEVLRLSGGDETKPDRMSSG